MNMNRRSAIAILAFAAACPWAFASPTRAEEAVRLIVGMDAGGGTDINARMMAKYLSRHFAGTISIENDGRAGGVTALQAALGEANLSVSTLETTNILSAAIEDNYPIDLKSVALLDNFVVATRVLAIRPDLGIKSVADWRDSGKTLRFGTRTPTYFKGVEMTLLSKLWGVNVTIVPGYSTSEARAAFSAGELDLISGSYTSTRKMTKDGAAQMLVRTSDAAGEDDESTNMAAATDFMVDDRYSGLLTVVNNMNKLQLALATSTAALADAGPLREALAATKLDPEFQAAATEAGLVVDKRSSDEIRAEFNALIADFDNIRMQFRKLL
jgi:tripartite-type tricarboxylate transporter receptor subunit TctC